MNYNERMKELNKINTKFERSEDIDKKLDELEVRRKKIEKSFNKPLTNNKKYDIL